MSREKSSGWQYYRNGPTPFLVRRLVFKWEQRNMLHMPTVTVSVICCNWLHKSSMFIPHWPVSESTFTTPLKEQNLEACSWVARTEDHQAIWHTFPGEKLWRDLHRFCIYQGEYRSTFLHEPTYFLPVLALKTDQSGSGTSNMRKTNSLASTPLIGYRGRAMIALSCVNYELFRLQACWDDCHCRHLLDRPGTPITRQLQALAVGSMLDSLSFQTFAQSPSCCPWALS